MTPVNGNEQLCGASKLTSVERHRIWISAAGVLVALLVLVSVALYYASVNQSPLILVFTYLIEVIAATSAGVLAGTITGFFRIELEESLSNKGRLFVQASGGFAVFLMVMLMSPREQMSDVADAIFEPLLADCRSATISDSPDAEGRCLALLKRFPRRPEPLMLLGRFVYRTSNLKPVKIKEARDYLLKAATLFGINSDDKVSASFSNQLSDHQRSILRDVVYSAAVTTADADLRRFGLGEGTAEAARQGLKRALRFLAIAEELVDTGTSNDYHMRVLSIKGTASLYLAHVENGINIEILDIAERAYKEAIDIDPEATEFLYYNVFFVNVIRGYSFQDRNSISVAREALDRLIKYIPGILQDQTNAQYWPHIHKWLKQMTENLHEDYFVVSRPIGGMALGGASIADFFEEHPSEKTRLLELF